MSSSLRHLLSPLRGMFRLVALCLMLGATCIAAAESAGVTSSATTLAVNDSVTVSVTLNGASPFANWGVQVNFDKAKLELTAQSTGTFTTFVPDSQTLSTINSNGYIRSGGFGFSDNAGGNGTLAVFTFKAIAAGSAQISITPKSSGNLLGLALVTAAAVERVPSISGPLALTITSPTPTGPEINVKNGSVNVLDSATDSIASTAPGVAKNVTYTVQNLGDAALTTTVTSAVGSNCTITLGATPTSVAAGTSANFTATVTPAAAGAWTATVSIANNDATGSEDPYNWTLSGTATAPAPEINVKRGTTNVLTGATDTITGTTAGTGKAVTYTIENTGAAALTISSLTATAGTNCTATLGSTPSSVPAGSSANFTLTVTPTVAGAWTASVSIANNDANEGSYAINVAGTTSSGSGTGSGTGGGGGGGGGCGAGMGVGLLIGLILFAFHRKNVR